MKIAGIPEGQGATGKLAGKKVAVYNAGETLVVLENVCTHRHCQTHWHAAAHVWECPCHGSRFDTDGAVRRGPARKPLPQLSYHVDDGEIYLD